MPKSATPKVSLVIHRCLSLIFVSPRFNQHVLAAHRSAPHVAVDRDKQWSTGAIGLYVEPIPCWAAETLAMEATGQPKDILKHEAARKRRPACAMRNEDGDGKGKLAIHRGPEYTLASDM